MYTPRRCQIRTDGSIQTPHCLLIGPRQTRRVESASITGPICLLCYPVFWICLLSVLMATNAQSFAQKFFSSSPKQWRIGYLEDGPHPEYKAVFQSMVMSLANKDNGKWIPSTTAPSNLKNEPSKVLWAWLAFHQQSEGEVSGFPKLKFPIDAWWSSGWNPNVRTQNKARIQQKVVQEHGIDLLLAFGIRSALDMAQLHLPIPVVAFTHLMPIRQEIKASQSEDGALQIYCLVDLEATRWHLTTLHQAIDFKTLGVAYENTPAGRCEAGMEAIEKMADELTFELKTCQVACFSPDIQEWESQLMACYNRLSPEVDAFYVPPHGQWNVSRLHSMLLPFFQHKVATFHPNNPKAVQSGIMMGSLEYNIEKLGDEYARLMIAIIEGNPQKNNEIAWIPDRGWVVNLDTAIKTEHRLPIDTIAGAQEIYWGTNE